LADSDIAKIASAAVAGLGRAAVVTLRMARKLAAAVWSAVRGPLMAALNVLAALIILFEEWGWRPLSELIARLAKYAPVAAVERWIAGLPPYPALFVIALPTTLLLPLKFVAVWLLANEHFATATALFFGAKVASTALIARVFLLTKPALMQIGWFAAAYNWFVPWKDALFARIRSSWAWRYGRMLKNRVRLEINRAWARLKPRLAALWRRWTGRELPFGKKSIEAPLKPAKPPGSESGL
jgi:hypothetical protein